MLNPGMGLMPIFVLNFTTKLEFHITSYNQILLVKSRKEYLRNRIKYFTNWMVMSIMK